MDIIDRVNLLEALGAKNTGMLRLFIEADPDKVNAPLAPEDRPGYAPLHAVAETGHVPSLDLLIRHGADINRGDGAAFTPLHVASEFGNAAVASRLVSAGADVHAKTTFRGDTPLHRVVLIARGRESAAIECSMLLINAGARISECNKLGSPPLVYAVKYGCRRLAKTFMRAGAEALDTSHLLLRRDVENASTLDMVDAVNAAGGWQEYARKHRRILAGLVAKLPGRSFPLDAASHVVGFWCPPGGY